MEFEIVSPKNEGELLKAISANQNNHFRLSAGGTDLLMELKNQPEDDLIVINLGLMADDSFQSITKTDKGFRIGALVTAAQLLDNKELGDAYPVLYEAAVNLASRQIRQVATIGGNLCTASPSGDISCALMALKSQLEIVNTGKEVRTVDIGDFFTGVRKTVLKKDEALRSIFIPFNSAEMLRSAFIKIGTRLSMECSVVSLAYHLQIGSSGNVERAGIAIGSVAPVIEFCDSACDYIIGNPGKKNGEELAKLITSLASPISDVRASAWYRKEVLNNISKSILEEWE